VAGNELTANECNGISSFRSDEFELETFELEVLRVDVSLLNSCEGDECSLEWQRELQETLLS
jgi:hypothetical protein